MKHGIVGEVHQNARIHPVRTKHHVLSEKAFVVTLERGDLIPGLYSSDIDEPVVHDCGCTPMIQISVQHTAAFVQCEPPRLHRAAKISARVPSKKGSCCSRKTTNKGRPRDT